jgi:hypothetical protein
LQECHKSVANVLDSEDCSHGITCVLCVGVCVCVCVCVCECVCVCVSVCVIVYGLRE